MAKIRARSGTPETGPIADCPLSIVRAGITAVAVHAMTDVLQFMDGRHRPVLGRGFPASSLDQIIAALGIPTN